MTEEVFTMSRKEIGRMEVSRRVVSERLRRKEATCQLALSIRRVKRWVPRYRERGPAGLVSRHRGKRPGNAITPAVSPKL